MRPASAAEHSSRPTQSSRIAARLRRNNRAVGCQKSDPLVRAAKMWSQARGVPETGHWSCCAFVFVDQAAEEIAAVDLFGGWRSRDGLAR